jgi:hypothetical protein
MLAAVFSGNSIVIKVLHAAMTKLFGFAFSAFVTY